MENEDFLEENYIKEEIIINIVWANIFSIIVLIIAILLFGIPFYFLWHEKIINIQIINPMKISLDQIIFIGKYLAIYLLVLVSIVFFHELIHGIFVLIYAKNGFKSIKFGIMPAEKLFTPYCHCKEKLKIEHYRIVIIMPLIIMGIIPAIISIIIGNLFLIFFGIICIMAACGDILIFLKTLKQEKDSLIFDHPTEAGFYIYKKINDVRANCT
jgi:hypothetical protein